MTLPDQDHDQPTSFVSTGRLPDPDLVRRLINEAHSEFAPVREGGVSTVYPALERVDPDLFGICLVGSGGQAIAVGDIDVAFTIMSVSKPFVFALVCQLLGPDKTRDFLGANATGLPFNSIVAVDQSPDGRTNPMVNSGAIAATSLVPGESIEQRKQFVLEGLSHFAGRPLALNQEVYASASATNIRNRAITQLLASRGRVHGDPDDALDLYTWQCSLDVTARDLAVMGATLASGGTNPITGEFVVDPSTCHHTLAVMITAGLYESSGDWLYDIGLPGKSGIGGGIVTVAPGKGSLGTFSPRLDSAGNSVRGQLVARYLSSRLGLDLLASAPGQRP